MREEGHREKERGTEREGQSLRQIWRDRGGGEKERDTKTDREKKSETRTHTKGGRERVREG